LKFPLLRRACITFNTIDFDESLVFSGEGAEINNFLIDLFLVNEEEEQQILSTFFQLEPVEFDERIEQLRKEKLDDLALLNAETELSQAEQEIAEVSINYTYYN